MDVQSPQVSEDGAQWQQNPSVTGSSGLGEGEALGEGEGLGDGDGLGSTTTASSHQVPKQVSH